MFNLPIFSYIDSYQRWLTSGLAVILLLGAITANLELTKSSIPDSSITQVLPDEIAGPKIGSGPGTCGIAVGIAAGVAGLAIGGVTVGIGAALAISAGLHAAAILCAASKT